MTTEHDALSQYLQRLRDDFVFFVEELWEDRNLGKWAPLSWVERDMCEWACNGPKLRGVLANRGFGKTWLITCTYAAWLVFRDPETKVLIVSKNETHAKKTLKLIRDWMVEVPWLQHLEPRAGQRDNRTQLDVGPSSAHAQPSISALGIDGMLEGNRAHVILADDIETDDNTITLESREALADRVGEFIDILYPEVGGQKTGICIVGTYHDEDSVYPKMEEMGYAFRSWPIAYPGKTFFEGRMLGLAPKIQERLDKGLAQPGDPLCPARFSRENIAEKVATGSRRFKMQHMLICDSTDADKHPLRLSDLVVMDLNPEKGPLNVIWGTRDHNGSTAIDPKLIPFMGLPGDKLYRPVQIGKDWASYQRKLMFIDPSGRGEDHTGCVVLGLLAGRVFVLHAESLTGGFQPEDLSRLSFIAQQCRVDGICIEDNFGGGMFRALFEPVLQSHFLSPDPHYPRGWKCWCEDRHSTKQKERRIIDTLGPVMETHRLIVDSRAITPKFDGRKESELQFQMTRLTKDRGCLREDGVLDALAGGVAEFLDTLRVDPEMAAKRAAEAQHAAYIDAALKEGARGMQEGRMEHNFMWGKVKA